MKNRISNTIVFITMFFLTLNTSIQYSTSEVDLSQVNKDVSRSYATDYDFEGITDVYDVESLLGELWFTSFNRSSLFKFNPNTEELIEIDLQEDITPLFVKKAADNTIWFLDYDFLPQNETDFIGRYDPSDGNLTLLPLPKNSHAITFEIYETTAFVSILNLDMVLTINTESYATEEIILDCEYSCGPAGLDIDSEGNLWIAETLGNFLVKYDTNTKMQTFYDLPNKVRSPAYIKITDNDILWTGTHAQDRLVKIDLNNFSITQYVSPKPNKDQYPISGINDIELSDNGDIWFAEHFINRIGRLHIISETVHEYISPRTDPYTSMIHLDGEKLWYPELTGTLGFLDVSKIPTVAISKISNQSINQRELELELDITYLSGVSEEIQFNLFGEVRSFGQFSVTGDTIGHILQKGESKKFKVTIELEGDVTASTYDFVIGINSTDFIASQQFYLKLEKDLEGGNFITDSWQSLLLIGLTVLTIYVYRGEISKLLNKIKKIERSS